MMIAHTGQIKKTVNANYTYVILLRKTLKIAVEEAELTNT